jgi:rod shape-determining protein MreC
MEFSGPPPLFKQGASARVKVVVFSTLALLLLFVDSHMRALSVVRQSIGTVLYPLQVIAMAPRNAAYQVGDYFSALSDLKSENDKLKLQQTLDAQTLQQGKHLLAENAQLRQLLGTSQQLPVKSILGEILYNTRDPFTRKIVLDRGAQQGVALGQPVIDHAGVVGQVTRVFPFTSEVTLLTDRDQAIPAQVVRNGLRAVVYGRGQSNTLDLRFMPTNADIRKGDVLVTSGIGGIYPPGMAVATVTEVDAKSADSFLHILCEPIGGINRHRQLLILLTHDQLFPHGLDHAEIAADKKAGKKAEKKAETASAAARADARKKPEVKNEHKEKESGSADKREAGEQAAAKKTREKTREKTSEETAKAPSSAAEAERESVHKAVQKAAQKTAASAAHAGTGAAVKSSPQSETNKK